MCDRDAIKAAYPRINDMVNISKVGWNHIVSSVVNTRQKFTLVYDNNWNPISLIACDGDGIKCVIADDWISNFIQFEKWAVGMMNNEDIIDDIVYIQL